MATDLTVILDDRAGQLAHMGEALGDAGVAIEGISATTSDGVGIVHEEAGRPGTLGRLAGKVSMAGINV